MAFLRALMARSYLVALVAGGILCLGFPVIGLWPLLIPGLALYFLNASYPGRTRLEAWWGGCITGALMGLWISYQAFSHLAVIPGAVEFSSIVRMSWPVIGLLFGGTAFGAVAVLYHLLRPRSILYSAAVGAALYTVAEMLLQQLLQGYYWASIAHPFAAFGPALAISSLGGTFLISFCVAWLACLLAEYALGPRSALPAAVVTLFVLAGLWGTAAALSTPTPSTGSMTIASVQVDRAFYPFNSLDPFIQGQAKALLVEAGSSGTDLVIYPQTVARGSFYAGTSSEDTAGGQPLPAPLYAMDAWLSTVVAPSSTALVWPQIYDTVQKRFYETFRFVKNGEAVAEYRKQYLYRFTDYYPPWMRTLGLVTRSDTLTAGPRKSYTRVGTWRIGAIDCSELNRPELARAQAPESDFLLSMGTDAPFRSAMLPRYTLAAAQYRAAENHISVLRVSLEGPSAIIGPDGSVKAMLPQGISGVFRGTLPFYEYRQTIYNRFGDLPLMAALLCIVAAALYVRFFRR